MAYSLTTINLRAIEMAAMERLDARELPHTRLVLQIEELTQDLYVGLRAAVWTEKFESSIRVPSDWIEAIKDRWLPQWARGRWPVRYRDLKLEAMKLYPQADYDPKLGPSVRHQRVTASFSLKDFMQPKET